MRFESLTMLLLLPDSTDICIIEVFFFLGAKEGSNEEGVAV